MSRISVLFILLSMVIVNSGDTNHSNINNNNNHNKNNSINHSRSHSFHQPYGSTNSTKVVNHPISSVGAAANSKQESQQEQQQQQPQQHNEEQPPRGKRATGDFQLDEAEIARQNQITQQIFAKYLERRLFPHRSTNERIPTISEILPKPSSSTTARPRPRGFSSSEAFHSFRRGGTSKTSGRKRYGNNGQKQNQRRRGGSSSSSGAHRQQLIDEAIAESEQDSEPTLQKPEYYADINAEADEVADDGQESLQSVESEQHDQYYSDVFNRDPSENEIDSDCPNCVDESQYTNKWTMPLLKLGEKRYYLGIFFKANWFKAAQYCRYHGMHLASISSQEENDRLEKHIRDFGLGHEHFWTSGTDLADEGIFFWMANGRPITFTNWNAGEPNNFRYENGEEENCLELWNRDGKGLKWNDSPCSFETFFVCEVQPN
ncbi:GATA zinc finger domain-containing protein 10 isoform X2 [Anastrepha obliqua]|uniref:GATA zinc finger domain-containing protein 10 isoform X2 n=1 Tax=Anastrepha obliqua TaxID=95512 RepID=UPI002409B6E6|nr:GATA zinc finger domain-containing protein 10 isoform X2 [Anastrepha obliqua]